MDSFTLGDGTEIQITGGNGTEGSPYTAEISGIKKKAEEVTIDGKNYTVYPFAIAVPSETGKTVRYVSWGDGSWDWAATPVASDPLNYELFEFPFDDGTPGTLKVAISPTAGAMPDADSTYYQFTLNFEQ